MASPRTPEEVRQLPKEVHKPVVFMFSSAGDRPALTPQELYALGYPLVIEPQAGLTMAYGAMRKAYLELKEKGRVSGDPAEIKMLRDEINELVDLPKYWELASRTVEE
jgi:2-methylisocitrate lyase-like PEP mutase family enzyme